MMIVQHQGSQTMDGMRLCLSSEEKLRCLNHKRKSGYTNPHRSRPDKVTQHRDSMGLHITTQVDRILH